jgi:hypothetical protein
MFPKKQKMQRFLKISFDVIPTEQSGKETPTAHFRKRFAKITLF